MNSPRSSARIEVTAACLPPEVRAPELFHLDDTPSRVTRGLHELFTRREGRVRDMVIDACRWHVDAEAAPYKNQTLDHFRDRYTVLLDFLRAEGLLADPALGQNVSDWLGFEFRRSHLTDEGFELVRQCHGTWNPAVGQGHTQRHLTQWRRKLARLRGSA